MVGRNRDAGFIVFLELVAQRPDRNSQNGRCMRSIAEAVLQRIDDQVLFHFRDGLADEGAADCFGGRHGRHRRAGMGIGRGQRLAVGQSDGVFVDFRTRCQQHGTVHRVFEFAHVAVPTMPDQSPPGGRPAMVTRGQRAGAEAGEEDGEEDLGRPPQTPGGSVRSRL